MAPAWHMAGVTSPGFGAQFWIAKAGWLSPHINSPAPRTIIARLVIAIPVVDGRVTDTEELREGLAQVVHG
jgi:hypothetical protein